MFLKVIRYPNPVLRKKAEEIKEITPEIERLAFDMMETMIKSNGIGLAAPQVGESKRLIIIQTKDGPKIFINPKILEKSKETEIMEEGCLCFPKIYLDIKRSKEVEFSALDEKGKEVLVKAEDLPARILQHEVEHLDGVMILDKIGFWRRLKLVWKLRRLKKHGE